MIQAFAEPLFGTLLSALFWTYLHTLVAIAVQSSRSFKFKNLIVATLHDALSVVLPLSLNASITKWVPGAPNTTSELLVLNLSCGYYLTDLTIWVVHGVKSQRLDLRQVAHHVCCITGIFASWFTGTSALDLNLGICITHLPSVFGYSRFFLAEAGYGHLRVTRLCWNLYLFVKVVAILALSPPVVTRMLIDSNTHFVIKVDAAALLVVNLLWLRSAIYKKLS